MFHLARMLYELAPLTIKRGVAAVPFPYLAGRSYRRTWRRTGQMEFQPADELIAFQREALRRCLSAATRFVPAYRPYRHAVERYSPEQALQEFPLLTKETLRRQYTDFVSTRHSRFEYWRSTTGGTTGEQLEFLLDNGAQGREMAFIHRLWSRVGYTPRRRKATFRGSDFNRASSGTYWNLNPIYNECKFSPFHINRTTVLSYLDQLRKYRPTFVHGYPSAISVLAKYAAESGISLDDIGIKAVLLASEGVFDDQRQQIEVTFKARVFSWYGHSERIILAGECEHSSEYHHFPDYGFLEIVDEVGRPVAEGEVGEIVGTGFWNDVMPLIRYRTGDRARKLSRVCKCGRSFERFDQVEGRWQQEYVLGKNGSQISIAALNMHGPLFSHVFRYQYYQSTPGAMELRLMVEPEFNESTILAILDAYRRRVGDELEITIRKVDDIPLTNRGKLRRLIRRGDESSLD